MLRLQNLIDITLWQLKVAMKFVQNAPAKAQDSRWSVHRTQIHWSETDKLYQSMIDTSTSSVIAWLRRCDNSSDHDDQIIVIPLST